MRGAIVVSLIAMVLVAIFWASWYLFVGSVPVVTSIQITKTWTYILPCAISRWWDVLFVLFWPPFFYIMAEEFSRNWDLAGLLFLPGIIVGFLLCLALVLCGFNSLILIGSASIIGLVVWLLAADFTPGVVGFCLGFSFWFGLIFSITLGFILSLVLEVVPIIRMVIKACSRIRIHVNMN